MLIIKIADIPIGVENRFSQVEIQARDYITDEEPTFTVSVSDEEIAAERELSKTDLEPGYYESVITYRKIAERLPDFDAFMFHGSAIELDGEAFVITASSGVGKTTHTRLWLAEFPDTDIINGDKPIIRIIDGAPIVFGTPWQGKENYGKRTCTPLSAIAFLNRAKENRAYKIAPNDAVTLFMSQIYLPKKSPLTLAKTLRLADCVIRSVRLVSLECNMEREAAHVARAALGAK